MDMDKILDMSGIQGHGEKKKKDRNVYSGWEKKIFIEICKNTDGGKIWKVVTEGTSTNQQRHDAWLKVAKLFSEAIGKQHDAVKVRTLWGRIRDGTKKKHDKKRIQFTKECLRTGGGKGPTMNFIDDPDEHEDLGLEMDDLDPAETDFNSLVRPEHRIKNKNTQICAASSGMTV